MGVSLNERKSPRNVHLKCYVMVVHIGAFLIPPKRVWLWASKYSEGVHGIQEFCLRVIATEKNLRKKEKKTSKKMQANTK